MNRGADAAGAAAAGCEAGTAGREAVRDASLTRRGAELAAGAAGPPPGVWDARGFEPGLAGAGTGADDASGASGADRAAGAGCTSGAGPAARRDDGPGGSAAGLCGSGRARPLAWRGGWPTWFPGCSRRA